MNYYDTRLSSVQTRQMLSMRGLPSDSAVLALAGIFPVEYPEPLYDAKRQTIEPDGEPHPNIDGTAYVQEFKVVPLPAERLLANEKAARLVEFDALFTRIDTLKIRPAAAIADALAAGEPVPQGDAYRLSELEAITAENRALRETVQAAETVEAVRAVSVWWPEERGTKKI